MTAIDGADGGLVAMEWAFGLLDHRDRVAAEERRAHDPEFMRACERWREQALSLLDGPEVAPAAGSWSAIERRLAANDDSVHPMLRRSLGRWRATAVSFMAVAAALGFTLAITRSPPPPPLPAPDRVVAPAPIVAILSAPGHGVISVSIDRVTGRITAAQQAVKIGEHSAELWVIPADQVPRSLGLVPLAPIQAQPVVGRGTLPLIGSGATLAVSLEPLGGSPSGKPTGPVILSGRV